MFSVLTMQFHLNGSAVCVCFFFFNGHATAVMNYYLLVGCMWHKGAVRSSSREHLIGQKTLCCAGRVITAPFS